ncbi:B-box zinc finger protein 20-like [Miscanthus floridulus]|uniref:B-box zinc finger protein 20-like n=1 Tax=Miscanthus floridulus TaxID=154761 RepID=UPI003459F9B3
MQVRCDVCGAAPAAVLCCADEAALCSACDRRVHRANKLAHKHRRIPLLQPASGNDDSDAAANAAAPLCDVCKERRGLVFCVEDRAILCPDCDDPIHSANDLTAKHTRFLLVGAKLSAALVDQVPPSPDDDDDCGRGNGAACEPDAVPAIGAQGPCAAKASALESGGGGGSSISDYLTNICPGWRVDDLLFDDPAFSAASKAGYNDDGHEQVPSLDADLFDVVAGGRPGKRGGAWSGAGALGFDKVPAASVVVVPTQGSVRASNWNSDSDSDVFAVPEFPQPPPAKRARPPPPPTFWCF